MREKDEQCFGHSELEMPGQLPCSQKGSVLG
jgi:hypothetical protein